MLDAEQIIRLWEEGNGLHSLDRSLCILREAYPQLEPAALPDQSVGTRNALLWRVEQSLFGDRLEGMTSCPNCRTQVEIPLRCRDFLAVHVEPEAEYTLTLEDQTVRFRLLTSRDLGAAAHSNSLEQAKERLLHRVLLDDVSEVEPVLAIELSKALAEKDPLAEVVLDLNCPECETEWRAALEIGEYLWRQLKSLARRYLREVHLLARAYGWSERDILQMSAVRRSFYLSSID